MELILLIGWLLFLVFFDREIQRLIFTVLPIQSIGNINHQIIAYSAAHGVVVVGILALIFWWLGSPYTITEFVLFSALIGFARYLGIRMRTKQ